MQNNTQTKTTLIPKLRFKEFHLNWINSRIGNFVISHKGGASLTPNDFSTKPGNEVIPKKAIVHGGKLLLDKKNPTYCEKTFFDNNENNVVDKTYLLTTLRDLVPSAPSIGLIVQYKTSLKYILAQGVYALKIDEYKLNRNFLIQFSNSTKYRRIMQRIKVGSTQVHIRNQEFFKVNITSPNLPEQQKIATFLTSVDTKIQQLTTKKQLLENYKKGAMQQLFSQQLRFKNDDGSDFSDWKKYKLIEVAERIKTKNKIDNQNVLTISAQLGLVSQLEYFNKSVSAKNLKSYYLLENNDFAYNKSYSNGYPMGAIKRLKKYDFGVVSTLYICFRFNNLVSLDFMEQYFEKGLQNKEIEKVAQEGARNHGLLNIGVNDFFEIDLKIPTLKEQQKIANYLSAIDKKIENLQTQIDKTQVFKKGLLQQMLV